MGEHASVEVRVAIEEVMKHFCDSIHMAVIVMLDIAGAHAR